jgi:hypothetical protein
MVFKLIRSVLDGREDANANLSRKQFLALLDSIQQYPLESQVLIAEGFIHGMARYSANIKSTLPEHCREDYIQSVSYSELKRMAENLFALSAKMAGGMSPGEVLAALSGQLQAYYFLSRAWQDFDHSMSRSDRGSTDASMVYSAPVVGAFIESTIHGFLRKCGQTLARNAVPSLSEQEIAERATSCLGGLLIENGVGEFQKLIDVGYLAFTPNSVFYVASLDLMLRLHKDTICYIKLTDVSWLKFPRPAVSVGSKWMLPQEIGEAGVQIAKKVIPWQE